MSISTTPRRRKHKSREHWQTRRTYRARRDQQEEFDDQQETIFEREEDARRMQAELSWSAV